MLKKLLSLILLFKLESLRDSIIDLLPVTSPSIAAGTTGILFLIGGFRDWMKKSNFQNQANSISPIKHEMVKVKQSLTDCLVELEVIVKNMEAIETNSNLTVDEKLQLSSKYFQKRLELEKQFTALKHEADEFEKKLESSTIN